MTAKHLILRCAGLIALLVWVSSPAARGGSILAGTDYHATEAAIFDLGIPVGPVVLTGAYGPGVADTALTRLHDAFLPAIGTSDTVAIQLRMLDLRSVAPVFMGGSFYDVSLHLDPARPSTGTMTISHEFAENGTPEPEGMFSSSMTIFFVADFVPAGPGVPFSITDSLLLSTPAPQSWSHEAPDGSLIVPGVPGDLDANLHAPRPLEFNDSFPSAWIQTGAGGGTHVAQLATERGPGQLQAIVPEPSSLVLLLSGSCLIALRTRRMRRDGGVAGPGLPGHVHAAGGTDRQPFWVPLVVFDQCSGPDDGWPGQRVAQRNVPRSEGQRLRGTLALRARFAPATRPPVQRVPGRAAGRVPLFAGRAGGGGGRGARKGTAGHAAKGATRG